MSNVAEYSECGHCWPFRSARDGDDGSTSCPTCGREVVVQDDEDGGMYQFAPESILASEETEY